MFHALSTDFVDCPSSFDSPIMTRCRLQIGKRVDFSNASQTAIYLHNGRRESVVEVRSLANPTAVNGTFTVAANEGAQVIGSNISVTCRKRVCYLSIWHTDYDKGGARYISDVPGCSFFADEDVLPSRFPVFFDFGMDTRVDVVKLEHVRNPAMSLRIYDQKTDKEVEYGKGSDSKISSDIVIDSPGILQFSSSKFKGMNMTIIAGTRIKMSNGFSNNYGIDMFKECEWDDATNTFSIKKKKLENYITITPYSEQIAFYIMSIIFYILNCLIFLISVVYMIITLSKFYCKKNGFVDNGISIDQE